MQKKETGFITFAIKFRNRKKHWIVQLDIRI